jgi:hypothetical protein
MTTSLPSYTTSRDVTKEIGRYRCRGDSGREYLVIEYQDYRRFQPLSGPAQDVPGTMDSSCQMVEM